MFACLKCPGENIGRFVNKIDLFEHLRRHHQLGKSNEDEESLDQVQTSL
jgi:hypothetical protein